MSLHTISQIKLEDSGFLMGIPEKDTLWVSNNAATEVGTFYYNNFFLEHKNPFFKKSMQKYSYAELLNRINPTQKPQVFWRPLSAKQYFYQYKLLQKEFKTKKLKKGVPYLKQQAHTKMSARDFFMYALKQALNKTHIDGNYLFARWDFSKNFFCLGVSPELLFHLQDNTLKTSALAGTVLKEDFSQAQGQSILTNSKLFHEHSYAVEDLKQRLSRLGTVIAAPCQLVELRHLVHLKTPLTLHLQNTPVNAFETYLKATFPSAAIGAFPRENGRSWLKKCAQNKRFFAAPFGLICPDQEAYAISMIRGFTFNQGTLTVIAGGGVVSDSVYVHEREEILWKLTAIRKEFGLFSKITGT